MVFVRGRVPLGQIARIENEYGATAIFRDRNGRRAAICARPNLRARWCPVF